MTTKLIGIFLFVNLFIDINSNNNNSEKDFYIALKQNNLDILKENFISVSDPNSINYSKYYSISEIQNIISPNYSDIYKVINWLDNNNIEVINNYGDVLHCIGNLVNINNAFNTNIKEYIIDGNKVYLNQKDYKIPKNLLYIIDFIEGLIEKKYPKINVIYSKKQIKNLVENKYSGREVINRIYNISSDIYENPSIGSIEYQENGGFSQKDLYLAENLNNVRNNTVDKIIGRNTGTDVESQLDIQMMGILVPNADLWFWTENNWLYSMAVELFYSKDIPNVISMSWGWAEDEQCTITRCSNETSKQYIDRVNIEYMKLGLRGMSILVSSGDAGAPGRTNEFCFYDDNRTVNAAFPGSSPYITSVGATYLKESSKIIKWKSKLCKDYDCATGNIEKVTTYDKTSWTSGGGFSKLSNRTTDAKWQDRLVSDYLKSNISLPINFNKNGRAFPDISVIGHYCPVINSGELIAVDGTSCSSPVLASIIAILNSYQLSKAKNLLGFLNPILYKMAEDNPKIFNDISDGFNWCTEETCCDTRKDGGSDFGYMASIGYDPVYGLGTPNVGLMKEWLDINT